MPSAQAKQPASAYDRAFLTDMIGHHAMAVDMAEMAREKASHADMRSVAEDIIRTQSAEIDRMLLELLFARGETLENVVRAGS